MANINMRGSGRVVIDGREYTGKSIIVGNDGKVTVDGVLQDGSLVGNIKIDVHGDVESMNAGAGDVTVSGSCGPVSTMSGDVHCGDVTGNIKTMSGDVTCGAVRGGVGTMSGDIRHK